MNSYEEIVMMVAKGIEFECSPDPDNPQFFCSFCLEPIDGVGHDEDCPMYKARELLGDKWQEVVDKAKQEIIEEMEEENRQMSEEFSICLFCRKTVKNKDMKKHQLTNEYCLQRQQELS